MAAERFLITVAPELASKATGFCPERHETCNYILMLERFETKTPIVASRTVNEDEGVLVASNGHAITECDVDVDDVEKLR